MFIDDKKNKEIIKIEYFLNDPKSDIGTGLLVTKDFGFCFTLKRPERWSTNGEGLTVIPFGGIGGKLEKNELPSDSLRREAVEEVGSDIDIVDYDGNKILMDSESIKTVSFVTDIPNEPMPIIVFRSPRAEPGRKPLTDVLIYIGKFKSSEIKPIDDPAIIEMDADLLLLMMKKSISVKEFKELGGRINSRIDLPNNGILKPIGTAIAIARCLENSLFNSEIYCIN